MLTRKDIEALDAAYRAVDRAQENLTRDTRFREQRRKELLDAHASVVEAEKASIAAQDELQKLLDLHGIARE